ncbi:hypothetical protein IV02_11435 [Pseudomonas syringae]|uniref:Uncharacterized protein n=1 Tax=Pseudomonas syringae TaxID=317 RepID=A0A085V8L6_PSESX|nr:hypothetical protein IV02_11435 [Pseudomonas syringae]
MFAATVPDQSGLAIGREHRHLPLLQLQRQPVALDTGPPAQWHLHQYEIGKRPWPYLNLGTVAQDKQLATPHFSAEKRRVDIPSAPAQVVFDQLTREQPMNFLPRAAGEDRCLAQSRQIKPRTSARHRVNR